MLDADDSQGDSQIRQLLQTAEMLVPSVPDVTGGSAVGQEMLPVSIYERSPAGLLLS